MLVNFKATWSILLPLRIFYGHLVYFVAIWVYFKIYLATLLPHTPSKNSKKHLLPEQQLAKLIELLLQGHRRSGTDFANFFSDEIYGQKLKSANYIQL
jgi:hypothetical protein